MKNDLSVNELQEVNTRQQIISSKNLEYRLLMNEYGIFISMLAKGHGLKGKLYIVEDNKLKCVDKKEIVVKKKKKKSLRVVK